MHSSRVQHGARTEPTRSPHGGGGPTLSSSVSDARGRVITRREQVFANAGKDRAWRVQPVRSRVVLQQSRK
ncbi:hypothetical protein BC831DRAFT_481851 [Entophlyctis helioformis]|nr:hypothetical protein BC831DRAFT_481851 [Entophlyctis helioformis]